MANRHRRALSNLNIPYPTCDPDMLAEAILAKERKMAPHSFLRSYYASSSRSSLIQGS